MSHTIIRGIEPITAILQEKKFLLVHDNAYDYLSVKDFFDVFLHVEFAEFTSNPLYEQVCQGVKVFNSEKCELIVAVGGGSTIDVAKCIKLYCKMDSSINYLRQETFDSAIPLVAIPTTAGTGSESTCHAVIYFEGIKQSISHASIIPDYAVLEPSVLKTLPVYQKKCTMLDALCQAIESWWSVNSTDESREYSRTSIITIKENWQDYIEGNTKVAAKKIMEAANYAGRAINITATTAPHAMSYKITSLDKLPHGHAVAVCMPEVWNYILKHTEDCEDARGVEYLKNTLDKITSIVDLNWFCNLVKKLKIESPVSSNKEADVEVLVESVNPMRLKNNPVTLDHDVLKTMYERIVK